MIMPKNLLQLVTTMIAPAVMISCCGLLLLSLSNKLGRIIDRIRELNAEDRRSDPDENPIRRGSIYAQIDQLVRRAELLKQCCGLLFLAVTFFVLTSLAIGLTNLAFAFEYIMIVAFVAGLLLVVWVSVLAYWEMYISHQTVLEEIKEARLR